VQDLAERVGRVGIEQYLHLGRHVVGKVNELAAARHLHQDRRRALRMRVLDGIDGVVNRFDRASEIVAADNGQAAFQRSPEQRRAQGQ